MVQKIVLGQGTTKGKTPEEMTAERRARKARQRQHHGNGAGGGESQKPHYLDGLIADRRAQREAEQAADRFSNEAAQVDEARRIAVSRLKPGSTAEAIANFVFEEFLFAVRESDKSKTQVAVDNALARPDVTLRMLKDEFGIKKGVAIARKSLWEAGEKIYKSKKQ